MERNMFNKDWIYDWRLTEAIEKKNKKKQQQLVDGKLNTTLKNEQFWTLVQQKQHTHNHITLHYNLQNVYTDH